MRKYPIGFVVVGLLTIGVASAVAQTASPTVVDLGKGKITGPVSFEATEASDVVMDRYVYDAAGKGHTWHSHPAVFGIVMAGSLTNWTGNASGCTSKTYTAGQSYYDPPGVPHVAEASKDVELLATLVGVPVGAAVSKDEPAPTGPNCPAQLTPGFGRIELSRSTIQGATRAAATGDSEMLMQLVTIPPGAALRGWFTTPASIFASVKSGSLTIFSGNATSCTSQTYAAGQGAFVPPDEAVFVRNDGSVPVEVYGTRLGLPVGAAPRVDAANPGGANCPDVAAAATPAPSSGLPVTGGAAGTLVMLGLGLTGMGTVARAFGRRR